MDDATIARCTDWVGCALEWSPPEGVTRSLAVEHSGRITIILKRCCCMTITVIEVGSDVTWEELRASLDHHARAIQSNYEAKHPKPSRAGGCVMN